MIFKFIIEAIKMFFCKRGNNKSCINENIGKNNNAIDQSGDNKNMFFMYADVIKNNNYYAKDETNKFKKKK